MCTTAWAHGLVAQSSANIGEAQTLETAFQSAVPAFGPRSRSSESYYCRLAGDALHVLSTYCPTRVAKLGDVTKKLQYQKEQTHLMKYPNL